MKVVQFMFMIVCALSISAPSYSQNNVYTNAENIAINGYDVVAYFNTNEAVRGNNKHTVTLDGAHYFFTSAENSAKFKANPEKYQPAYGGYCAFGMGMQGVKAPTDPKTFKIRDGKLYLFYNDFYEGNPFNTIIPWNANEQAMIKKADKNWKKHKM